MKINFIKKILAFSLALCLCITSLTGCSLILDQQKDSNTITKANDYPVELYGTTLNSKPQKVAVLSYSLADIVIALGYEGSLALASDDCTQPDFTQLSKVDLTGDLNKFNELAIDLILADNTLDVAVEESVRALNIPIIKISPATGRNDFERLYKEVGSALYGASTGANTGSQSAQDIFTTLDDLSRIIPTNDKITTVALITNLQNGAIVGSTVHDTMLSYLGLTNIFKGNTAQDVDFSQNSIQQPEYIFCVEGLKEDLIKDPNFMYLDAVAKGNVYELPYIYFISNGRTLITCATDITGIVYPELLEEDKTDIELPDQLKDDEDFTDLEISAEPESSADITYDELPYETNSDEVLAMQERLHELGYLTVDDYDGFFGETTLNALNEFCKSVGLSECTDVADSKTLASLFDIKAPFAQITNPNADTEDPENSDESSES